MDEILINEVPAFGDYSNSVLQLQKRLAELGYDPNGQDGIFGKDTKLAIVALQKDNGLYGYGIIGPNTLKLLHFKVNPVSVTTGNPLITRDLADKKSRHLHPAMRQRLEEILFENGKVPDFWENKTLDKVCNAVQHALAILGIKEYKKDNYGVDVGQIQGTIGGYTAGGDGQAWCLDFAQMKIAFIEDYYQKASPVPAEDNCVNCWKGAVQIPNLTTQVPTEGTLALAKHTDTPGTGHAMECYKLLGTNKMKTVEGNLDIPFSQMDISGFNERDCFINHDGELRTLGFVYVYPNNLVP